MLICLCGSTRFPWAFQEAAHKETLRGNIVLSVHVFNAKGLTEQERWALNEHHLRQLDLADEVFFLNVDGYIGKGGHRELLYAEGLGKPIRFLEPLPTSSEVPETHDG